MTLLAAGPAGYLLIGDILRSSVPTSGGWRFAIGATLIASIGLMGMAAPAQAASATHSINDAVLTWGFNNESGAGAYDGSCNYLSAGKAGNTTKSRAWTEGDGFFAASAGNVRVEKPRADNTWVAPTWADRCYTGDGAKVVAYPTATWTGNRLVISNGTGTLNPADNTAEIQWVGDFAVAFYGGLTYWNGSDPKLVVNSDGTAQVTATVSGYGADMEDSTKWDAISAREVVLANLTGVSVATTGFTVTPNYVGVTYDGQSTSGSYWGAFPSSFVDFQQLTGQASYWYSSGTGGDVRKVATALTVGYTPEGYPTFTSSPTSTSVAEGKFATFTAEASADDAAITYQWQSSNDGTTWSNVTGATASTYSLIAKAAGTGTQYRAVATSPGGSTPSSAATLTVTATGLSPKVTISQTAFSSTSATTVTVKGTGFNPDFVLGTRPPLAGTSSGVYVVFAKFADVWKPSTGALSASRPTADVKWAVLAKDLETIGGASAGAVELKADGSFETTLTIDKSVADTKAALLTSGNYGVYTYGGGGGWQPAFETVTPVAFPAAPTIAQQPAAATQVAGKTATLVAKANGAYATYRWESSVDNGKTWTIVAGATSQTLRVAAKSVSQSGTQYRFVVTNAAGSTTSRATTLTVKRASAKATAKATKKSIKAKKTSSVKIKVTATGLTPSGKVKVTWKGTKGKAKGKTVTKTVTLKRGAATAKSAKLTRKGTYSVTVKYLGSANVSGVTKKATNITVK